MERNSLVIPGWVKGDRFPSVVSVGRRITRVRRSRHFFRRNESPRDTASEAPKFALEK